MCDDKGASRCAIDNLITVLNSSYWNVEAPVIFQKHRIETSEESKKCGSIKSQGDGDCVKTNTSGFVNPTKVGRRLPTGL